MAKAGFRIMDSDIHVLEPHALWVRYMEPGFREQAPRFAPIEGSAYEGWQFDGKVFPAFVDRPDRRRLARVRKDKARVRHLATGRYRDPAEDLPGGDPQAMLQAMDREGIDVSIVFRTMASHLIAVDGLDPKLSAAVCRGFNNWLGDFCDKDRTRLKPAALIPLQDTTLAVEEARRAVRDLGAVALILSNHPVDGPPWYDTHWDPVWAEAERLGCRSPSTASRWRTRNTSVAGSWTTSRSRMRPATDRADAGARQPADGRCLRALPWPARGLSRGQLQLGALVAVGARRAGGEVRRRRALRVDHAA